MSDPFDPRRGDPQARQAPGAERRRPAVADLCALPVRDLTATVVLAAVRRSQKSRLSLWDALIVESALDAGAAVLLTEDLLDGDNFGELRVRNPFRESMPL